MNIYKPPETQIIESEKSYFTLFFYLSLGLFSFFGGILSWFMSERINQAIFGLIGSGYCLIWIYYDSKSIKRKVGQYLPMGVILVQPLGMLFWFIGSRKWRGILSFIYYMAIFFGYMIVMNIGHILLGFLKGYTLSQMLW